MWGVLIHHSVVPGGGDAERVEDVPARHGAVCGNVEAPCDGARDKVEDERARC